METNGNIKAILAFLGGVAAGAAIGVLLAPEKGEDTRKKISEGASRFGDTVKRQANAGLEHLTNAGEQVKEKFNQTASQLGERFNDGIETAKKGAQEITPRS